MVKVNRESQLWTINCNTCGRVVQSKIYCRSCFEGFCFNCTIYRQPHFSCPFSSHFVGLGTMIGIQICCRCKRCRLIVETSIRSHTMLLRISEVL